MPGSDASVTGDHQSVHVGISHSWTSSQTLPCRRESGRTNVCVAQQATHCPAGRANRCPGARPKRQGRFAGNQAMRSKPNFRREPLPRAGPRPCAPLKPRRQRRRSARREICFGAVSGPVRVFSAGRYRQGDDSDELTTPTSTSYDARCEELLQPLRCRAVATWHSAKGGRKLDGQPDRGGFQQAGGDQATRASVGT